MPYGVVHRRLSLLYITQPTPNKDGKNVLGEKGNILPFMIKRKSRIEVYKRIGLDRETYLILREQKKLQKKSMLEIVKNLILEKYAYLQKMPK